MTYKKISIKKDTVMETLVLPLYGRAYCSKHYPDVFPDKEAEALIDKIDYDFEHLNTNKMTTLVWAIRKRFLCDRAKEYLKKKPYATIVNLGCGADNSFPEVDNGKCRWINLDLPDIIEARKRLFTLRDCEKNVPCSAFDTAWFDEVETAPEDGLFIISGGVLMYFDDDTVKGLFTALAERFPGGGICFDAENQAGTDKSNKVLEKSGNTNLCLLVVDDAETKFRPWSKNFGKIVSFDRLPEYVSKAKSVPFMTRKIVGMGMKMGYVKIVEIMFK